MKKLLIYDCEIINLIPQKDEECLTGYWYCDGWHDFSNMGISVIGTWRNFDIITLLGKTIIIPLPWGKYEAFVNYNSYIKKEDFKHLSLFRKFYQLYCLCDSLIGFNSISFDDKLMKANGLMVDTDFDLLCEVRETVGMPRHYVRGKTRGGYNLNNLAVTNGLGAKSGSGKLAPILWQDGKYQEVIEYCLNDVKLLKKMYFRFIRNRLVDPHTKKPLTYF
ncbi:hypothetical protein WEU38_12120 [Cyanobacterium aponinum AL20118]|uniref:Uncharacterized protein n=1 Tax=Cyanobacterium aponinum AL20115 TaxID=3090662 RepID=A0AAF0ZC82_9CHRO|nr:hypothetical protein [Cyanobacterium aponinum]WPF87560.1 hypothetical protein SAY89_12175 [Cyanobacterium aponinum AL20115]